MSELSALLPVLFLLPACLCIAWSDWHERIIPNRYVLVLLLGGILWAILSDYAGLKEAGSGVLTGLTLGACILGICTHLRANFGFGGGDVKLIAASGAWVGWQGLPPLLLMASIAGLVTVAFSSSRRASSFAFGPALAVSLVIVWFWQSTMEAPWLIP
jgi:prepilin signal peptidase PulO-like enzyme (type II secretory pathway)